MKAKGFKDEARVLAQAAYVHGGTHLPSWRQPARGGLVGNEEFYLAVMSVRCQAGM